MFECGARARYAAEHLLEQYTYDNIELRKF